VVIGVFGIELPEEIGLEDGRGGLVFEVGLDEGGLDLTLGRLIGTGVLLPRDVLVGRGIRTSHRGLGGRVRHRSHKRVRKFAVGDGRAWD
jgi:hypothetical protein